MKKSGIFRGPKIVLQLAIMAASLSVFGYGSHGSSESSYNNRQEHLGANVPQYLMRPEARSSNFAEIDQIVAKAQEAGQCKRIQEECSKGCRGDEIPLHALQGMAASFTRSICGRGSISSVTSNSEAQRDPLMKILSSGPGQYAATIQGVSTEILNNKYKDKARQMGIENVAATYAVIAALPAQEADYNIIEGVDKAKSGESHSDLNTQEAGMFQVSANSQNFLVKEGLKESYFSLLNSYVEGIKKAGSDQRVLEQLCMPAKFTADGEKNGKGVDLEPSQELGKLQSVVSGISTNEKLSDQNFIMLQKACPAFATEYMALLSRVTDKHNGPLKRGDLKTADGCEDMFLEIGKVVEKSPAVCEQLGLRMEQSALNF